MVNYSVGKRLKHHSLLVHAAWRFVFTQDIDMLCVCKCVLVSECAYICDIY